jgi:putative ABC transport system permease protein
MGWLFGLAVRNVTRNTRRSLLTALTVLLGTALLTLGLSWLNGVMGMMLGEAAGAAGEVRIVEVEYAERESTLPLDANIYDVAPILESIESVAPSTSAFPIIRSGATVSVGEELGDTFALIVGAPEGYYKEILGFEQKVRVGAMFSGEPDEVLIGRLLAQDLEAEIGDELVILGQTQDGSPSPLMMSVHGVVDTGNAVADRQVFMSLERSQWLTDIPDGALEVLVYGEGLDEAAALADTLRASGEFDELLVQAWSERELYASMINIVSTVFGIMAVIIVLISALGVLNTMVMSVLERTAEIGVLRAMGMRRVSVVSLFVTEAAVIGVVGSIAGLMLGSIPSFWLENNGVTFGEDVAARMTIPISTTIYADLTIGIAGLALMLGILMALIGALVPSIKAAAIQPVSAMRRRR